MKKLLLLLCSFLFLGGSNTWGADTFLTTWTGQVGTNDNQGSFKYATKKINVAAGETYVYTLTNYNGGGDQWLNWTVEGSLNGKFFDCEARGYQWPYGEGAPTPSYTQVIWPSDVDDWMTKYNGANVTITISRNNDGTQYTITHTSNVLGTTAGNTDKYYGGTWTVAVDAEDNWDIYITEESSHFVVTSVTYTDAESNVTNYNPVYQRGYTTTWSDDDKGSGKWTGNGGCSANADGLNISNANGSRTWTNTSQVSPTSGYILKYDIIYNTGASYGTNNDAYLKIGDAVTFTTSSQGQYGNVTIGSNDAINIANACSNSNGNRDGDVWSIHMVVNTTTHKVTELTINGNKGTTKVNYSLASEMSISSSASFSSLTIGTHKDGTASNLWCGIKSINIDQEEYEAPKATVTYKYEDTSGNSLSAYHADVQNNEVIGATISDLIVGDLIAAFYNGTSNKYVYADDYEVEGDYTEVQAGGNTVILKFTDYPATAYTVKAQVSGSDLATLASGTAYLDGSTTEYWSKYIQESDQWYVADEATYGAAITAATTNVAFTASDDVDYFFECEDFSNVGHSVYAIRTDLSDASNGKAVTPYSGVTNGVKTNSTISSGVYDITIKPNYWRGGATDYTFQYSTDGDIWTTIETVSFANNSNDEYVADGVVLPANSYLRLMSPGSTPNHSLDYIIAEKTADLPSNVSKTITSAKWATYCSPYILDFSSSIANLTAAYIITGVADSKLTLVEVDGTVPANTGLLLKGEGACTIPVATSSSVDVSGNKLVGVTTSQNLAETTGYVLMGSPKVGFYKNTNAFTLGANTAYLPAGFDAGARTVLYLDEDDAPMAINAIEAADAKAAGLKDGKYLINGRIVMVNNGKAFSANGQILK